MDHFASLLKKKFQNLKVAEFHRNFLYTVYSQSIDRIFKIERNFDMRTFRCKKKISSL